MQTNVIVIKWSNGVLPLLQTGSGKTYTMGTGLEVDNMDLDVQGIVPRAVHHLFTGITERRQQAIDDMTTPPEFKVTAHFMELYNEEVIDLFDPNFKVSYGQEKGRITLYDKVIFPVSLLIIFKYLLNIVSIESQINYCTRQLYVYTEKYWFRQQNC